MTNKAYLRQFGSIMLGFADLTMQSGFKSAGEYAGKVTSTDEEHSRRSFGQ